MLCISWIVRPRAAWGLYKLVRVFAEAEILTFQGRMKEERTSPHCEVAHEGNEVYRVVTITNTTSYAFEGQVHEYKIRESVDNFSRVDCGIVILRATLDSDR